MSHLPVLLITPCSIDLSKLSLASKGNAKDMAELMKFVFRNQIWQSSYSITGRMAKEKNAFHLEYDNCKDGIVLAFLRSSKKSKRAMDRLENLTNPQFQKYVLVNEYGSSIQFDWNCAVWLIHEQYPVANKKVAYMYSSTYSNLSH